MHATTYGNARQQTSLMRRQTHPSKAYFVGMSSSAACVLLLLWITNRLLEFRNAKITPCHRDTVSPRTIKLLCRDNFALSQLMANSRRIATWFDRFKAAGKGWRHLHVTLLLSAISIAMQGHICDVEGEGQLAAHRNMV